MGVGFTPRRAIGARYLGWSGPCCCSRITRLRRRCRPWMRFTILGWAITRCRCSRSRMARSGVGAIANLTGVMRRPVYGTAGRSIWVVAAEVAVFNLLLAAAMCAMWNVGREAHKEDMLAYMAKYYVGPIGEWPVRILGGLLLLSATNTAVNGLMSVLYVMSRDGE